ncbi:MAG: hypothetical protein ABJF23_00010 [Bryobacteraceae bacterium]
MYRKRFVLFLVLPCALLLVEAQQNQDAAQWFSRPSELPKDVFDLPQFSAFRNNGKLDVAKAQAYLEELSDSNLQAAQKLFDIFAWQAFVALNSPASGNGGVGPINPNTPLVWESWQQTSQVFLPNGQKPAWMPSPAAALDHFKAGWRQFPTVNEGKQAFSGPLVDQNGRWVHYVSFMNRVEFDYVVKNELYNLEGQAEFVKTNKIEFPENSDTSYGSIEIKLAWKILTAAEERSNRFLVKRLPVVVYRPAAPPPADMPPAAHVSGRSMAGSSGTNPVETLGLIGMHISMRTRSSPQWIWATFEQIDNTRLDFATGDSQHPLPGHPSLSNPDNPEVLVSANLLPAFNAKTTGGAASSDWDESLRDIPPVEVLRIVPPPQGTQKVNLLAQAYLGSKNSVLRYYELNGTQWPKHPKAPAVPGGQGSAPESIMRKMPGEVVPVYLTNSTMETYFQKGLQAAAPLEQDNRTPLVFDTTMVFGTESCVGCHYSAGVCIGFRKDSAGKLLHDANGNKIPIFGENANGGSSANANFSWLLQLEARAKNPKN